MVKYFLELEVNGNVKMGDQNEYEPLINFSSILAVCMWLTAGHQGFTILYTFGLTMPPLLISWLNETLAFASLRSACLR